MNFRTEISLSPTLPAIDHASAIFMTGSCFSENISLRLSDAKFQVLSNPTGILFNPMSIRDMIVSLSPKREFTTEDLHRDGDMWFSWSHHGSFSDTDPEAALRNINDSIIRGASALEKASHVIITFGTAWVYHLASDGRVVANCHKQPAELFERRLLSPGEIVSAFTELLEGPLNGKKVIFTLSPVRHLRDGFDGNSLSKAILRVAIAELVGMHDNSAYFPAFEIMTDDLRDYRFYGQDMVHPSPQAVDYIWEKFTLWCMDDKTRALLPRLQKIAQAMAHRPIQPDSRASSAFRAHMREQIALLGNEIPAADFSREMAYFKE